MTPKEKANELTGKNFKVILAHCFPKVAETWKAAKECTLIAVDEILNEKTGNGKVACFSESCKFWENVKEEINKL